MSPAIVSPLSDVKALTFDVFGTTVDWRSCVVEELTLRAYRKHSADLPQDLKDRLQRLTEEDWGKFAQAWRDSYMLFTRSFDPERDQWKTIDDHHRDSLIELLSSWGLSGLYTDHEIESLSLVWHRLSPWPDTVEGLQALTSSRKVVLATLTNGNLSLARDLNDFGALGFHKLFCAETFRAYKPNPATYLGAARELNLEPGQVAMVAAHLGDLQAARSCGLRTIYIERPNEEAWAKNEEKITEARGWVDLWISQEDRGFITMSSKLLDLVQ